MVGQALVWIALLVGSWKCWSISRRPATNAKCALALMFMLLGFLGGSSLGILGQLFGTPPVMAAIGALLGFAMLGLTAAAIVFAILGLFEFSRHPGVFVQGRAQAVWALCLAGVIGLIAGGSVVAVALRAGGFLTPPSQGRPSQVLTFDDLNFRFRTPSRPWVPLNAAKVNKDSKVAFMRRFPEAYFLVIAEKIGSGRDFSTAQLAEVGKAHLQASAESSRILSESPWRTNGLTGLLVETEAQRNLYTFYYVHWYIATNGYAYQLIGYGRSQDRQRIAGELRQMCSRFDLLDPNRVASAAGAAFRTNFVSTHFDYMVHLTNSAWHPFPSLESDFPAAEFGASQGDSCLAVVPVWLGDEKPDAEAVTAALLATLNIAYPNEKLTNRQRLREGELEGVQFDFSREVNGHPFHYRLKLLQQPGTAYLVAAWSQRRDPEAVLADAIGRVHFTGAGIGPLSAGDQLTPHERKTRAFVLNQAGLHHFNSGEYERAVPLLSAAARANSQEAIYARNALQAWKHLDRPKEALDFIAAQPASLLAAPETRALQAFFQAQAACTDLALTNYASLFAEGYRNDAHFTDYITLLNWQRQYDQALREVRKYLEKEDTVSGRLLEADIYRLQRDFAKAISVLKAQHEKAPFNSQVSGALAETSLQAGLAKEALEISQEMVKANRDSAYAQFLKGRSELSLKWYREAKVSFEAAARLAPANKDIASYVEHVSGLIGEGNNTNIKEPIEPVALPAALTNSAASPVPEDYAKSYGAYYIRRVVAVAWEPGKELRTTECMLARVLDASGVSEFSTVQFPFDPLEHQLYVNEVRVMDSTGKTISSGNVSDYYVLDDRSGTAVSHKKVLNVPIPGLQPGCQLAVTITRRELGTAAEFPFLEHYFSRAVPVRDSALYVRAPAGRLKYRASPAREPQELEGGLLWRVADPLVARWEPQQPAAATFLPLVALAEASAQWPAVASNYLASIADRLEPDASVQALAHALAAGLDSDEARIAVLTHHVQTNYTYKAIEFGRRARIPNKPSEIVRNKYGDCKDHAVLLEQMLRAIGVPARLALASHRGPIQEDLPSLDQFDHMILFVPGKGTGRFVDCTDKGGDAAQGIPLGLAERRALILDPQNPRFAAIPGYPPDASRAEEQRHLRLVDQTDVAVDETLTLTGAHAAYLRGYLVQVPASSRRMLFQRQAGLADVELTDFNAEALDLPYAPLRLHCAYILKRQFHRSADRLSGILRAGLERPYLAVDAVDNRLTPFEVTIPLHLQSRVWLAIPDGFSAERPAGAAAKLDPRFASCQSKSGQDGQRLTLELDCRFPAGTFNPSNYAAYRATMAQVLSMLEQEVILRPARR
jgi:tetratricopeptide (TPR) repeat protein